jgi:hypothetical protein
MGLIEILAKRVLYGTVRLGVLQQILDDPRTLRRKTAQFFEKS